jgi:hypothetical protein
MFIWELKVDNESKRQTRITATAMKFIRKTTKHTWMDYKENEDILLELKTEPVLDKILKYKTNCM